MRRLQKTGLRVSVATRLGQGAGVAAEVLDTPVEAAGHVDAEPLGEVVIRQLKAQQILLYVYVWFPCISYYSHVSIPGSSMCFLLIQLYSSYQESCTQNPLRTVR